MGFWGFGVIKIFYIDLSRTYLVYLRDLGARLAYTCTAETFFATCRRTPRHYAKLRLSTEVTRLRRILLTPTATQQRVMFPAPGGCCF